MISKPAVRTNDSLIKGILDAGGINTNSLIGGEKVVGDVVDGINWKVRKLSKLLGSNSISEAYYNFLRLAFQKTTFTEEELFRYTKDICSSLLGKKFSIEEFEEIRDALLRVIKKVPLSYPRNDTYLGGAGHPDKDRVVIYNDKVIYEFKDEKTGATKFFSITIDRLQAQVKSGNKSWYV